jgi:hypothetical protein
MFAVVVIAHPATRTLYACVISRYYSSHLSGMLLYYRGSPIRTISTTQSCCGRLHFPMHRIRAIFILSDSGKRLGGSLGGPNDFGRVMWKGWASSCIDRRRLTATRLDPAAKPRQPRGSMQLPWSSCAGYRQLLFLKYMAGDYAGT